MRIPLDNPGKGPKMADYHNKNKCVWCDGCGNYGIWTAVKRALVELGYNPWEVMICYDVGCNGNMSDKLQGYKMHGLHGRVIPFAAGCTLANPNIPVIAHGGDGASFSEGVGHFVHGIRSNYPMVFILHNNANYGLTTGQASSLTWQDTPMHASPNGIPERTLNSMDFVFSLEPTFVARGSTTNIDEMVEILKAAIKHNGFAFVDFLQACPTYNKFATHDWLLQNTKPVSKDHDKTDFKKARKLATDTSKKVTTGVLYQSEFQHSFIDHLVPRQGIKTTPVQEVKVQDVSELMSDLV